MQHYKEEPKMMQHKHKNKLLIIKIKLEIFWNKLILKILNIINLVKRKFYN